MTVMVLAEMPLKSEIAEMVVEGMKDGLTATRAFEGCEKVDVYYQTESCTLAMVEYWASAEAYEAYIQWRHDSGAMDGMGDILAGEFRYRIFSIRDDI